MGKKRRSGSLVFLIILELRVFDYMVLKGILLDLDNLLYCYDVCNKAGDEVCFEKLSREYNLTIGEVEQLFMRARREVKKLIQRQAASHSRLLYFKRLIEMLSHGTAKPINYAFALELEELFWKTFMSRMKLPRGVGGFLQNCRAKQVKVCIVTDHTTRIQLRKIAKLGLDNKVDFVVTSEEVGVEKPNSRIFQEALARLGLMPSEVVMIGDSIERDKGAEKIGIKTIIVDKDFWLQKPFKQVQALVI